MELQGELDDLAKGDRPICERGEAVPLDMLDRMILDPGTRTIGELVQEREWAVGEIRRLRVDVGRLSLRQEALRIEGEMDQVVDPALNAHRLLRLSEVMTMIGLGHTSIYNYVAAGTFPAPIKVGENSVRWKLADILAWRARISDAGAPAERKESGASRSRRPRSP
jgi:prophage regulatory protein